jgi:hypothetical protein
LVFGEPYINTDLNTLLLGGNGTQIQLLNISGGISASLIPQSTNAFDLGSATNIWKDLYISTGSIKFVAGTTVVKEITLATFTGLESATGSINSLTASISPRLTNLETTSASVNISISSLNTVTSSLTTTYEGRASATKTIVSGSSQISLAGTTDYTSLFGGIAASTSSLNTLTGSLVTTYEGRASATKTIVSGAIQVLGSSTVLSGSNAITITGTSTALGGTITLATITGGSGIVSGSSQITAGSTTNFATDVKTQLNTNTVVSGSSQVTLSSTTGYSTVINQNVLTTSDVTHNSVTAQIRATNGVVSGSSQVVGSSITTNTVSFNGTSVALGGSGTIPNLVSGSSQITLSSTTGGTTASNVQFNSLGIGIAATGTAGRIDASGDIVAFSTSDKNFKENIKPIENALEKISKISGNTYDWKPELKELHGFEGNDVGVIAQEIEAVLPQLVTTRESGYKAVKYDKLVALLIEGIKEQQTQIHSLTLEIEKLKEPKSL